MTGAIATAHRKQMPTWLRLLLASASGIGLALPYVYPALFPLAWIAFVPVLLLVQQCSPRAAYGWGLVVGLWCYYLATHWITDFLYILKGYGPLRAQLLSLLFWFYCAQLLGLLLLLLRWLQLRLALSPLLVFPPLAAVLFSQFPMLFSVQLGDSQVLFPLALQGIAYTGVYGLDAMIALCNVLIAQYLWQLLGGGRWRPHWHLCLGLLLLATWFGYGGFSLRAWDQTLTQWPTRQLGLVQPNEYPDTGTPNVYAGYSRAWPPEMAMTELLVAQGAELVIWPETRFKGYFARPHVAAAYQHHVARLGVPLLFQDMEPAPAIEGRRRRHHNTVLALDAQGQEVGHYRKIKRIPFGEALPGMDQAPALRRWLEAYLGDFFHEIIAGEHQVQMQLGDLQLAPLICYETIFPRFSAQALGPPAPGQVLVAMSSNAWFGESRQPYQHFNASALRAVENRTVLVHAMNNGPSGVVLPSGRIATLTPINTAGGYLVTVPVAPASQRSLFNRYPHWFLITCCGLLGALTAGGLWRRRQIVT